MFPKMQNWMNYLMKSKSGGTRIVSDTSNFKIPQIHGNDLEATKLGAK